MHSQEREHGDSSESHEDHHDSDSHSHEGHHGSDSDSNSHSHEGHHDSDSDSNSHSSESGEHGRHGGRFGSSSEEGDEDCWLSEGGWWNLLFIGIIIAILVMIVVLVVAMIRRRRLRKGKCVIQRYPAKCASLAEVVITPGSERFGITGPVLKSADDGFVIEKDTAAILPTKAVPI